MYSYYILFSSTKIYSITSSWWSCQLPDPGFFDLFFLLLCSSSPLAHLAVLAAPMSFPEASPRAHDDGCGTHSASSFPSPVFNFGGFCGDGPGGFYALTVGVASPFWSASGAGEGQGESGGTKTDEGVSRTNQEPQSLQRSAA